MLERSQARQIDDLGWMVKQEAGRDPGLAKIVDEIDARETAQAAKRAETAQDLREQGVKRRDEAEALADDIASSVARRMDEDYKQLREFERKYQTEGLTARELAWLEDLRAQFDELTGPRASRILVDAMPDEIDGVKIVYGFTRRQADGFLLSPGQYNLF
jgi:hypothetical protein